MISKRGYTAAKILRLRLPLWRRTSDYGRYVIIGLGRCGSNMLRGLLNSHPRILALGELFRDLQGLPAYDLPLFSASRADGRLFRAEPVRFLERRIFKPYPSYLSAVGFKGIYSQLARPEMSPVLDHLRDQEQLKVIHLKRRDTLKTYLSHLQAKQHQRWINTTGIKQRHRPLAIAVDQFRDFYRRARDWEGRCDEVFRHHQKIELFYEDLVADFDGEMSRVQAFLGVERRKVVPLTYRQSYLPLSAAISNYAEIEEELAPFISESESRQ
jgi:Sulfotransferase family